MTTAVLAGASVGELLDQATEHLYAIAVNTPAGANLMAAWPAYQRACSHLLSAAIGPRITAPPVQDLRPDADPVLTAGLKLHTHLSARPHGWPARPEPKLTRASQLIGAAGDLIQCAHDHPNPSHRDAAQADPSRRAGITRAAELTLTAVDLTIRACGRPALQANGKRRTSVHLTAKAADLFDVRRAAADVLDASGGQSTRTPLDDVRALATAYPATDLLGWLENAVTIWTQVSLAAATRPAVCSAELQRSTIEARHLIALAAALTNAADLTGAMQPRDAEVAIARLQRAGAAWAATTNAWTRYTTGVRPSEDHIRSSLELQAAVRAITRDDTGRWLTPDRLLARVELRPALELAQHDLRNLADVAQAHADAATRLSNLGGLYAPATALSLTEQRVTDRLQRRHTIVSPSESALLRAVYRAASQATQAAHSAHERRHRPSEPLEVPQGRSDCLSRPSILT